MNSDKSGNRPMGVTKINMIQYWTLNCNHMQCEKSQLWSNDDRSVYKKQGRQLLAKLSSQSGWKIRLQLNLTFWRHFGGWKFGFLWLRAWEKYNIFYLQRIRNNKRRKTNFLKFGPFSVQSRPKFGRSSAAVSGCSFYLALFKLCGRTIGQLATSTKNCVNVEKYSNQ